MLFQEGGEELTGVEGTELGRKGLKAAIEKGTINLIVPNLTFLDCVNLLSIGEDALNQYLLHRVCDTYGRHRKWQRLLRPLSSFFLLKFLIFSYL